MAQYAIIGNGVASTGCIKGIPITDKDSPITVILEEKPSVYCRPLISYYLEGKTDLEKMNHTSLIREKTPLDPLHFELLKKVATFAAFPADARRKKFGSVV